MFNLRVICAHPAHPAPAGTSPAKSNAALSWLPAGSTPCLCLPPHASFHCKCPGWSDPDYWNVPSSWNHSGILILSRLSQVKAIHVLLRGRGWLYQIIALREGDTWAVFVGPSHLINSYLQRFVSSEWSFLRFISDIFSEMQPWPASTERNCTKRSLVGWFLVFVYSSCSKQQVMLFVVLSKSLL